MSTVSEVADGGAVHVTGGADVVRTGDRV